MDISTVNPAGANQGGTLVQARASEVPVVKKSQVHDEPVKVASVEKADFSKLSDGQREERVQAAAKTYFNEFFAVRDTSFSIYKDSSGQFITRFTNLRDGTVTYIPEPDIVRYMESKSQAREALIEINV